MSLLRGSCVDIYGLDSRFNLDLRLRLLGLPLLVLCAVILIVVDSLIVRHFVGWNKFSRYLAVEGSKFGLELLQLVLLAPSL